MVRCQIGKIEEERNQVGIISIQQPLTIDDDCTLGLAIHLGCCVYFRCIYTGGFTSLLSPVAALRLDELRWRLLCFHQSVIYNALGQTAQYRSFGACPGFQPERAPERKDISVRVYYYQICLSLIHGPSDEGSHDGEGF